MAASHEIPFSMEEIFDFMHVDFRRYQRGRRSCNMPCPRCDGNGPKSHLNVNFEKKTWRCAKCGSYGNGVNYYALVTTGSHELSKDAYADTIKKLKSAIEGDATYKTRHTQYAANTPPPIPSAPIAPDAVLHKTFSGLLQFPALALTQAHAENLMKRGLDEAAIIRNGYRSVPTPEVMNQFIQPAVAKAYAKYDWASTRERIPRLKYASNRSIMLGLTVAKWLQDNGCQLEGVPGFFLFKKHWCFLFPGTGILIPTRNMKGQIVGLQVRRDEGAIRYMTISAKELDMGVSENISRVHWPLANTPLRYHANEAPPEIILTEGPLKADVAIHLYRQCDPNLRAAFVAIQGVNTTKQLLKDCEALHKYGYNSITNALDMDRLTNVNVMNGSKKLHAQLRELGMSMKYLFWNKKFAMKHWTFLMGLCRKHEIKPPPYSFNIFFCVAAATKLLYQAGVKDKTMEWDNETKGIDDYLLSCLSASCAKN